MLEWTRMLDVLTCTMSAMAVTARARAGSLLLAGKYAGNSTAHAMSTASQREVATAHAQLNRFNR